MAAWIQLLADVAGRSADEVDVLSGELWAAGVGGIEIRDEAWGETPDRSPMRDHVPETASSPASGPRSTRLVIGVTADGEDSAVGVLVAAGLPFARRELTVDAAPSSWPDDWVDARRDHAVAHTIGAITVVPEGADAPADVTTLVVAVDAGRSFGHGGHVTTRLALEALQAVGVAGRAVLDIGCGSGVLAVAAARLGASRVLALDVAAEAVDATSANAARNRVDDIVEVRQGSIAEPGDVAVAGSGGSGTGSPFDVVVANIEAPVLEQIAPGVVGTSTVGGVVGIRGSVVLSGFLTSETDRVARAYAPLGVSGTRTEGEWSAVVLGRVGPADRDSPARS